MSVIGTQDQGKPKAGVSSESQPYFSDLIGKQKDLVFRIKRFKSHWRNRLEAVILGMVFGTIRIMGSEVTLGVRPGWVLLIPQHTEQRLCLTLRSQRRDLEKLLKKAWSSWPGNAGEATGRGQASVPACQQSCSVKDQRVHTFAFWIPQCLWRLLNLIILEPLLCGYFPPVELLWVRGKRGPLGLRT